MNMKDMNKINILFSFLITIALFACSDKSEEEDYAIGGGNDDIPVVVDLKDTPLPAGLNCYLYIFSKSGSDSDYSFDSNYTMTSSRSRVKFLNKDLKNKSYRFLFVATSSASPEVKVLAKSGNIIDTNHKWADVMIRANSTTMTGNNYSVVLDKSGAAILNEGNIQATLTRMVGQMTFDIYKVKDTDNPNLPDTVALPHYNVLDRVYKIEIGYAPLTKDLTFDTTNQLAEYSHWTDTIRQIIEPKFEQATDSLRIDIMQKTDNLTLSSIEKGSASIKGIYCMPSNQNMSVKMTFYSYDTTPKCGDPEHAHTKDCYQPKTLVLNLPQKDNTDKLSVKPNYYTVNIAKIWYNRIIDLEQPASFGFDTTWENEKP